MKVKFRQTISVILSLCMIISVLSVSLLNVSAEELSPTEGFSVECHENGTAEITNYSDYIGTSRNVVIPSEICGYKVTSIGMLAFVECVNIVSVYIPDSITSIGEGAFCYCLNLEYVSIPDSVTIIDEYTFCYCPKLASVDIPESVNTIGADAFLGCANMKSVIIPENVESIGSQAFGYNNNDELIDGFVIYGYEGSSAERYANDNGITFESLSDTPVIPDENIVYKVLPDGTAEITDYAGTATNLKIPSAIDGYTVTSIGNYAFYDCATLINVSIPETVTSIGRYAFQNCTRLASINIPDSVTSIDKYAFCYCSSLKSINIPDSVTSIGGWAFRYCTSLASVTIGDGITIIDDNSFAYCENLSSLSIGSSVTSIGMSAFSNCTKLTGVTLPDSLTKIGTSAFGNCTRLKSVTIPEGVTTISNNAFYGCTSMKSITIPESVSSIGSRALGYYTNGLVSGFVIYGYKGSAAQTYAADNGITFESLSASVEILIGDLNLDGEITIQDATIMQKHIAKMTSSIITDPDLLSAADTDNDGFISVKDVTNIQKYIAHMSESGNVGMYIEAS